MENIITLPVSELKTALTGLSKVVNKASTLPVLQSIRVCRDNTGTVSLQGTDLDAVATYTTNQPGPACEFLVPLEALSKTVKSSRPKDSVLLVQDQDTIKLRTYIGDNAVDQKLDSLDIKEWPALPVVTSAPIKVNGEFHTALKQAFECASEDATRYILQGAYLDTSDPKAHYIAASNGRIMFSANSFSFDLPNSVIIPNHKFLNWSALSEEEAELSVKYAEKQGKKGEETEMPGWIQYKNSHWTFIIRQPTGQFPNWRQVVPANTKTFVLLKEGMVENLLGIIPKVPGDYEPNYPITLNVKQGIFYLEGKPKDSKEITQIPISQVDVGGPDVQVALNRQNLAKALKFGLNEIHIVDELTPVTFRNLGKRLVVSPLRMEWGSSVTAKPSEPVADKPVPVTTPPVPAPETTSQPTPETQMAPTKGQTEERKPVSKTTETTTATTTAPETKPENPVRLAMEHLDHIKASLGDVIRELAQVTGLLRQADKEKRATDKEIESVRDKLREIQAVKI